MTETERERVLIEALGRIASFCDMRPATSSIEEVEHLLAAVDAVASGALLAFGGVRPAS
jgi:hypothetical protein